MFNRLLVKHLIRNLNLTTKNIKNVIKNKF